MHPPNPVAIVGSKSYSFRCALVTTQIDRLQNVTWLLNGTVLESLDLIGVTSDFSTIGSGIGKLTFTNLLLEYNYTTIKCRGHLESGRNSTSGGVILLLQGIIMCSHTPILDRHSPDQENVAQIRSQIQITTVMTPVMYITLVKYILALLQQLLEWPY